MGRYVSVVKSQSEVVGQSLNEHEMKKNITKLLPIRVVPFCFHTISGQESYLPPAISSTECCQTSGFLLMLLDEGCILSLYGRMVGPRGCAGSLWAFRALLYMMLHSVSC